jgi:type IV secretory pathway VirJ component
MTQDAKFEDGREVPLNLGAMDAEDVKVISALTQDAVFPVTEMTWRASERRFAILLNRFRWEDADNAKARGRDVERVQSLLVVDHVTKVSSQGVDRKDKDTIYALLSIEVSANEGSDEVTLILSGDGAIRLSVEALELSLKDVTRPYIAPSKSTPDHGV